MITSAPRLSIIVARGLEFCGVCSERRPVTWEVWRLGCHGSPGKVHLSWVVAQTEDPAEARSRVFRGLLIGRAGRWPHPVSGYVPLTFIFTGSQLRDIP
jgi:hypothetical protein